MAPSAEDEIVGLVGDIGGTNARFGIARVDGHGVRVSQVQVLHAAQFPRGPDAVAAYLASLRGPAPQFAVLAAAGPITRGAVEFTNNRRWKFSETGLMRSANLKGVRLINDFTAQALALPHLRPKGLHLIGPRGAPGRDGSAVVMGPGTGFGAAAMAQDAQGQAVVTPGQAGLAVLDGQHGGIEGFRRGLPQSLAARGLAPDRDEQSGPWLGARAGQSARRAGHALPEPHY